MTQMSSNRWINVDLDAQTEHAAAEATVKFLLEVQAALFSKGSEENKPLLTVPFDRFDPNHLQFILATVGSGEVRATVGDSIRLEETMIEGLWRIQENGVDRFEVVCVPDVLLKNLSDEFLTVPTQTPEGVFAASAIRSAKHAAATRTARVAKNNRGNAGEARSAGRISRFFRGFRALDGERGEPTRECSGNREEEGKRTRKVTRRMFRSEKEVWYKGSESSSVRRESFDSRISKFGSSLQIF